MGYRQIRKLRNGFVFLFVFISGWKLAGVGILGWNCTVIVYVHARVYGYTFHKPDSTLNEKYKKTTSPVLLFDFQKT
jgi:hypothetical protein